MAASVADFKLAGVAAGFTLGFGFLTTWQVIKQTASHPRPHRSPFIVMVWGEILANIGIGVVGWLFLERIIPLGIPVLCSLLGFWVFEIHFLIQIVINRIMVVAEKRHQVVIVRWSVAAFLTLINIAVFCIWVPAHLDPPPSEQYVIANRYWDRTSKVLILLVDAALNIWFVLVVQHRLVKHHGLSKYTPLVRFNIFLIFLSIGLDALLIGLMSLQNQLVYIQFHPVVYVAKLNIELAMAELLKEAARLPVVSYSDNGVYTRCFASPIQHGPRQGGCIGNNSKEGIHKAMDFEICIEEAKERTVQEVV
ncbi:hypothetical protein BDV33DRAFT_210567 [Aspergillus novoparasiticus]|uniref:Organic solute transporter Ostalpha-domain-containing protein n=1 Tax=Aspergillus novoparasiticus TaxID=986946 RepID=A0A5N6E8D2_9EURO|nr:hypothetical protein BDV33DRAFT_210567 [Aspergillus novoparasiticus]